MQIHPVTIADLTDCQAIYAHHVLHGTGSFEEVPPSLEQLTARFETVRAANAAWLVARDAAGVAGYGYYGAYNGRAAYRFTAEDSLYIRDTARRQGVGKAILAALLEHAAGNGIRQMLALVGDADNTGSIGVHASLGFVHCGRMQRVGFKFGRWLDVVVMQKSL